LAFAKCPKCLRPELTSWPAKNYQLPLWKNLLVTFGATRYRCAACRHRFVSFRPIEKPVIETTPENTELNGVSDEIDSVSQVETKS